MLTILCLFLLAAVYANPECIQVKKQGKQKEYCEQMLLNTSGSEATIACFVNFCDTCCGSNSECIQDCRSTHVSSDIENDPEEVFIKVCAADRMRDAMKPFCDKYYSEEEEKNNCFNSFCFDCCSGELKILSTSDPEVKKCVSICVKKMQSDNSQPKSMNCFNTNSTQYCNERFNPLEKDARLTSFSSCVDNYCDVCCRDEPNCISQCMQSTLIQDSSNVSVQTNSNSNTESREISITPRLISSACYDTTHDQLDFNKCIHSYCYAYCSQDLSCTKQCLKVSSQTRPDPSITEIFKLHDLKLLNSLPSTGDFDDYLTSLKSGTIEDQLLRLQNSYNLTKQRATSILSSIQSLQFQKSLFLKSSKKANKYEV